MEEQMKKHEISIVIGNRLRARRMELGYSQSDAAEKSGLHHTYIGQVERGEKNATVNSVERICTALDMSLADLFANISEPTSKLRPAQQCYDLIISQPVKDQQMIYSLLENIIKYKNN
jgi:transcriptional regulator with XRE-family HTH domain